ncbi:Imm1 family immunity protein [Bounagaea algeriensis]
MTSTTPLLESADVIVSPEIDAEELVRELCDADRERRSDDAGIVWFLQHTAGEYEPSLTVGVRGDVGALTWFTATDVHVPAGGAYSHWVDYFSRYGHHMAVPSGAEVPVAAAHAALYEYARTGTRPRCVDWVRLDDVRPPYPEQDA